MTSSAAVEPPPPPKPPEILVVDDEPSIRRVCVITLRTEGWNAVGEGSAKAALERLTSRGERYDALVIDYAMPEMNGLELIAALDPKIRPPILLTSAHADGTVACAALKLGVWDFQAKPLVPEELRLRVRRLLSRAHEGTAPDAWLARAMRYCQACAWSEALRELQAWPESSRTAPAPLLTGLIHHLVGDQESAAAAFKNAQWATDWDKQGGDVWAELARRLG